MASADTKVLGYGSYGSVISPPLSNRDPNTGQPIEYSPNNWVTKILYDSDAFDKIIHNADQVSNIMGSNNYKLFPHSNRMVADLGQNLAKKVYSANNGPHPPTNQVYAVRMRHFGISIDDILREIETKNQTHVLLFRKTDFQIILSELLKCITQLKDLADKKYIHGDVRPSNIMWSPKTGQLRIIDFDWLLPYRQFIKAYAPSLGYYSNPPEAILLNNINHDTDQLMDSWVSAQYSQFGSMYNNMSIDSVDDLDKRLVITLKRTQSKFIKNRTSRADIIQSTVFPSFDSYGFALTMGTLFTYIYPGVMNPAMNIERIRTVIESRITHQGTPYSAPYLKLIASTLFRVRSLLWSMASFDVTTRTNAVDAYTAMKEIYDTFMASHAQLHDADNNYGLRDLFNNKKSGGRRLRKTRRTRRRSVTHRKKKTLRKH